MQIRVGILTVSDRSFRGEREDESGPLIRKLVQEHLGAEVAAQAVVPDEEGAICEVLISWCDELHLDLILT
ncbi:molybdenum cofactor biosynthesis protein, partial [Candidatus Bipolaricaulota bacterium]|nr:molybdenum cofactor biosynthesis protein [Candidatus Bipolaricaulota bacterium]